MKLLWALAPTGFFPQILPFEPRFCESQAFYGPDFAQIYKYLRTAAAISRVAGRSRVVGEVGFARATTEFWNSGFCKQTMMNKITLRQQSGFSLVEIFITLVIFSIIAALALPSYQGLVGNSKIVSTTNEFVTSIHLARSEAIKRDARVGLCPSVDPLAASPVCSATNSWASGWIVFVDDDEDGTRDAPGEELLLRAEPRTGGFSFAPPAVFQNRVYFESDGTSIDSSGNPVSGDIVIQYGADETRNVSISATGRVQTVTPTS